VITLEPHSGINLGSGESEHLPQDRILVDGHCVGYIGHKKGDVIQLISPVSEAERVEIEARVIAKFGGEGETVGPPLQVTQELLEALEDSEDE
jgi:hypothetical protein